MGTLRWSMPRTSSSMALQQRTDRAAPQQAFGCVVKRGRALCTHGSAGVGTTSAIMQGFSLLQGACAVAVNTATMSPTASCTATAVP